MHEMYEVRGKMYAINSIINGMSIKSFQDLEIYQESYKLALEIFKRLLPKLPQDERWELVSQIRRSSKAIPAIVAKGYAKKQQPRNFQRYLYDALGETNEMIVHLSLCCDLYPDVISSNTMKDYLRAYEKLGKQIYCLAQKWKYVIRD